MKRTRYSTFGIGVVIFWYFMFIFGNVPFEHGISGMIIGIGIFLAGLENEA